MGRGSRLCEHSQTSASTRRSSRPRAPKRLSIPSDRPFRVRTVGDRVLVDQAPFKMMKAKEWRMRDRPFRSVLLRAGTGEVLSVGFPKFFNYGEHEGETKRLDEALAAGQDVWFTEKLDGSLVIRSVIDGEVHFRTRGAHDGGQYEQPIRAVAAQRYPRLLDPSFAPERSIQMEFVSPYFPVIVPYDEDDLVLIGATEHANLRAADLAQLRELADAGELRMAEVVELPREREQLLETVRAMTGSEGVVVRFDGGQRLLKLKGSDYLLRHRMRYFLTTKVIREVCDERGVTRLADFEAYLNEQGADFEMAQLALPLVQAYIDANAEAAKQLTELRVEVQQMQERYPERKQFALQYASQLQGSSRSAAFGIASNYPEANLLKILREPLLEEAFAAAERAEMRLAAADS